MTTSAQLPSDVASLHALVRERDAQIEQRDSVIEARDASIEERDTEIAQLREYVRLLRSQRFGASSERTHRNQLGLFNEAEQLLEAATPQDLEEETLAVPAHTRAKGGRRPLPSWMGRVEILHDLPEDEKV
jgi:uncharacterized protein (DUF3084 family)